MFYADCVHRGEYTGYTGAVGVGLNIYYRFSATEAGLDTANIIYPHATGGFNIDERTPAHYGNTAIIDAWQLEPGYYEVLVYGTAHSTGSSLDGLAAILAQGDYGLNRLVIYVVPGMEVITE
jgi:hypothetical protein